MSSPSPTQLARDVKSDHDILRAEFDALRDQIRSADLAQIRERLAVIEDRIAKLEKYKEESDKRHWQVVYIIMGAALALLGGIVIELVKK